MGGIGQPDAGGICVIPLGPVRPLHVDLVAESVASISGARVTIHPGAPLPAGALDITRGQHDADLLLGHLVDLLPDGALRVIGVVDGDLFAAGRSYVFGYAHLRDGVAVCSLLRLAADAAPAAPALRARVLRTVRHEVGHTFDNPHCEASGCVMRAVQLLAELDALPDGYCPTCAERVRRGLAQGVTSAQARFARGGALLRRGRLLRAADAYRDALALEPENGRFSNDLGVALLSMGERSRAASAFVRAAALAPELPQPFYNLGIIARQDGKVGAADRLFRKALRLDPDQLAGHRYLGRLHEDVFGDAERAALYYRRYLAGGGEDPVVLARARALGLLEELPRDGAASPGDAAAPC